MRLVASNFCPQTGLHGCAEDNVLPHLPSYATSAPVSMHHIMKPQILTCLPHLHRKEASSVPSSTSTPSMSHFLPCLAPRVLEKVALARLLWWGQQRWRGKSCWPGQQQVTAHQLAGVSCWSYTTSDVEELAPGLHMLFQSNCSVPEHTRDTGRLCPLDG